MVEVSRGTGNTPRHSIKVERRRYRRFLPRECELSMFKPAPRLLQVLRLAKRDNLAHAAVDLSEGGARFITRSKVASGTSVRVTVHMRLFNDSVETRGTVLWCVEHATKAGCFVIGVNFGMPDPVRTRKIAGMRDYLNSPEYKQKDSTRKRLDPDHDSNALEYDI